jgi:hypothetical protein
MLKRKKLMKLKRERVAAQQLAAVQKNNKSVQQLVETCVKNTQKRRRSAQTHANWRSEYAASLQNNGLLPARLESMQGIGAKKSVFDSRWKRPYADEMAEREAAALVEVAEKAKRVAPVYNKGAYQYVGGMPEEDLKTLGRKV